MMEFMLGLTFFARTFEEQFLIFQDKSSVTREEELPECVKVAWKLNSRGKIPTFLPNPTFVCDKSYVTASMFRVIISWIHIYIAHVCRCMQLKNVLKRKECQHRVHIYCNQLMLPKS
jgi:hypothetical protein